jgi:hypothetical protein
MKITKNRSKMLHLGMVGVMLTFGFVLMGASWGLNDPSGSLTISNIPAEHEGKLVLANLFATKKEIARGNATAVTNGILKF